MRFLRAPEVCERVGLSRMQLWRLERDGKFPKRVQISTNSVGWVGAEVDAWLNERIERRDQQAPEAA